MFRIMNRQLLIGALSLLSIGFFIPKPGSAQTIRTFVVTSSGQQSENFQGFGFLQLTNNIAIPKEGDDVVDVDFTIREEFGDNEITVTEENSATEEELDMEIDNLGLFGLFFSIF